MRNNTWEFLLKTCSRWKVNFFQKQNIVMLIHMQIFVSHKQKRKPQIQSNAHSSIVKCILLECTAKFNIVWSLYILEQWKHLAFSVLLGPLLSTFVLIDNLDLTWIHYVDLIFDKIRECCFSTNVDWPIGSKDKPVQKSYCHENLEPLKRVDRIRKCDRPKRSDQPEKTKKSNWFRKSIRFRRLD